MRYYYLSFMGADNSMYGNHVMEFPYELELVTVHKRLATMHKKTCVVLFYEEITKQQHDEFQNYAQAVDGGDRLPQNLILLKKETCQSTLE